MYRLATLLLPVMALMLVAPVEASQRRVRHHVAPPVEPLIIQKRSYLDPGNVVPAGSYPNYVTSTMMSQPAYSYDDRYNGNLPSPYFMPGRPQPIFQFETPGSPE